MRIPLRFVNKVYGCLTTVPTRLKCWRACSLLHSYGSVAMVRTNTFLFLALNLRAIKCRRTKLCSNNFLLIVLKREWLWTSIWIFQCSKLEMYSWHEDGRASPQKWCFFKEGLLRRSLLFFKKMIKLGWWNRHQMCGMKTEKEVSRKLWSRIGWHFQKTLETRWLGCLWTPSCVSQKPLMIKNLSHGLTLSKVHSTALLRNSLLQ